jgi:cytochrome c peroxidase
MAWKVSVHGVLFAGLGSACGGIDPVEAPDFDALSPVEQARVELGHRLFFDPGMSSDGATSCASCHRPDHGGADDRATSMGADGRRGRRNAPSVWSAALVDPLMWDGRAASLEEQATMPLLHPDEMNADPQEVVAWMEAVYADDLARAFPGHGGVDLDMFATAIAAYERQLVAPGRVDRYLLGDRDALDDREVAGLRRFRRQCGFCHGGEGVGGEGFEVLGDARSWPAHRADDLGLYELTGDPDDRLVFRVPSLRHAASTPPYFHDGSVKTLREAVRLMGWHQIGREFDEADLDELVAFLEALDGRPDPRWLVDPRD